MKWGKVNEEKKSFTGQLGFVFAAAGSAVGVGNLWRFPFLAAKDGGGVFLLIYLVLIFYGRLCAVDHRYRHWTQNW